MARIGGQNKSGPNLSSPNQRYTDSRSLSGDKLNTPEIDVAAGGNPSSHVQCRSKHSGENNSQKMRSNKKGKHRNSATSSLGKSDDKALYNQQSVDIRCNTSNPEEKELLSSATEIRRESEKSSQHGCGKDLSLEKISVRMFAENVLEKARCIACMAASILRTSIMYVMEESKGFIERKKPAITSFMTAVSKGHTYVRCKIQYAYPIVRAWMFNAGKLLLLLLMVWLDCNMRGFDSLLRLGTTSFLAILWCSMLSIFAMIGMKKMLIFMVTAVSVAAFVGLGFAVLITSVFALIILWLYGSFWMTIIVIILGGTSFFLNHERFAILVTSLYSMYCAKSYVGWLGLLLSLNLSFISSDVLVQFLRSNVDDNKFNGSSKNSEQSQGRSGNSGEFHSSSTDGASPSGYGRPTDRNPDDPSTSGAEKELTAEDEVIRLLNCTDHYSALGFRRYENIDVSLLKREYKKKAMLVHPDKNMGNEKSADAFKKLQNAYEVLLDSFKQKTYDDELRREELLNYFRRFQGASQKKGRNGTFRPGFSPSEGVDEGPYGLSRRIACKKCGDFHTWIYTGRAKSQARWCQECKEFHQAKDGDGWVEQSFQPLLFGMLQKRDFPRAYVCAESRIFDVTEWFSCQGMRCPANTHRPSFQVNTSLAKQGSAKGSTSSHRGGGVPNGTNMDEGINEEEFFEWLQNAVQSGVFETFGAQSDHPSAGGGSNAKSSSGKKKRKGKKQW